jgi:choline dehydrogenase-like flavoprotein
VADLRQLSPARLKEGMRRHQGAVDVCIVGAGAGGAALAKGLADKGLSVVVLEAGSWLGPEDYRNDELSMLGPLDWDSPRESGGSNPLELGRKMTGRGVGGSTLHYTAVALRPHRDDFRVRTVDGVGCDWPIGYDDLAPYMDEVESFLGVSGPQHFPWGEYEGPYPMGPLPLTAYDEVLAVGMDKLGYRWVMTPHTVITGTRDDGRSPCMYYGFCVSGCKSGAKSTANVTWIPAALRKGAEVRDGCMAVRVNLDARGRARSVTYLHDGREFEQEAAVIALCCYSIETPRLLLLSTGPDHPDGLANGSGCVGKYLMAHLINGATGRFEQVLDPFVSPPIGIMTQDTYGTQADRDFLRGYTLTAEARFPFQFAETLSADLWGEELMEVLDNYPRYGLLSSIGEMLPYEDNGVSLSGDLQDEYGLPVAKVIFSHGENERRMGADMQRVATEVLEAAGARGIIATSEHAHVLGGCRMGTDPATSVVDANCRTHEVENLYIVDGSVFPSGFGVNPSITIHALALRAAEHIAAGALRAS